MVHEAPASDTEVTYPQVLVSKEQENDLPSNKYKHESLHICRSMKTRRTQIINNLTVCLAFIIMKLILLQFNVSSSPPGQSCMPSQRALLSIHLPLKHWKLPLEHSAIKMKV